MIMIAFVMGSYCKLMSYISSTVKHHNTLKVIVAHETEKILNIRGAKKINDYGHTAIQTSTCAVRQLGGKRVYLYT